MALHAPVGVAFAADDEGPPLDEEGRKDGASFEPTGGAADEEDVDGDAGDADPQGVASWQPWIDGVENPEKARRGFTFSMAGRAGAVAGIEGVDSAAGVSFFVGWQFNDRVTLGVDWLGVSHGPLAGSPEYQLGTIGPALRYWVGRRFWILGSMGGGGMTMADPTGETSGRAESAFVATAAASYQAFQGKSAGMDIELRASSFVLETDDAGALTLGIGFTGF